jgi:peptide/nickel transport system permease protein
VSATAEEPEFLSPELVEEGRPPSMLRGVLRTAEGKVGLVLGVFMLALIIVGPLVAPYPPTKIATGFATSGPSASHPLGTDQLGRDMLSRFLCGGRSVLLVPLAAVVLSLALGGALGMLGAYRPGTPDLVIVRGFDLVMALPALLIVLVLIAGLGTSVLVVVITVALVFAPRMGRVVRGATQSVVTSDYVAAAQLRGESTGWILARELLPNIAGPVLATFALYLTYGIIFVATLSFLGLGAQPPSSDWGLMVAESRTFFALNPWGTLAPALGIAALSVAFTLLADAVNRHLSRGADRPETAA